MKSSSLVGGQLEAILTDPDRGIVGLVEELLAASSRRGIQLGWRVGTCSVTFLEAGQPQHIEVSLGKSAMRAVLARVAVLCNERNPGSVSPYGGRGIIAIDTDPSSAIRATFVNTPETQSLELALVPPESASRVNLPHTQSIQ